MNTEITENKVLSCSPKTVRGYTNANAPEPSKADWTDWIPLVLLSGTFLLLRNRTPGWVFMSVMVVAIYAGCKWLTWRRAFRQDARPPIGRCLAYLLAWPGMNAGEFFRPTRVPTSNLDKAPTRRKQEWVLATVKTLAGAGLVCFAAQDFGVFDPLLIGWIGLTGLVLFLHFGVFQLVALGWQSAGIDARPVMRDPFRAASLAEFWGSRWNTAFNALAHDLAFRPLARRLGMARATIGVFLISGFVHELAISFPARGGYGLPTVYFLLQACGLLFERSRQGSRFGLGRGLVGRLFVLLFVAGPVFWLFHPPFVINVILPMLRAIGAK